MRSCAASSASSPRKRRTWPAAPAQRWIERVDALRERAARALGTGLPPRPPTFCVGCPERPVFAAIKLVEREVGKRAHLGRHRLPRVRDLRAVLAGQLDPRLRHEPRERRGRRADDGAAARCRSWATAASGTTASSRACRPALLNGSDSILLIMQNGYSSATGTQELLSSPLPEAKLVARGESASAADRHIENTLQRRRREVAAHRPHLPRVGDGEDPARRRSPRRSRV